MAELFRNYIGGEWLAGATVNVNRSPSDTSDVVGEYAQADAAQAKAYGVVDQVISRRER
mgnify:CR=1 FL=1